MTIEEIKTEEIPHRVKCLQENTAIYAAAKKLLHLGPGRALKIGVECVNRKSVQQKAHVFYRRSPFRLRSRNEGKFIYLWIEEREPKKFEVVGVPLKKLAQRA